MRGSRPHGTRRVASPFDGELLARPDRLDAVRRKRFGLAEVRLVASLETEHECGGGGPGMHVPQVNLTTARSSVRSISSTYGETRYALLDT
jgi:hypothetical protein